MATIWPLGQTIENLKRYLYFCHGQKSHVDFQLSFVFIRLGFWGLTQIGVENDVKLLGKLLLFAWSAQWNFCADFRIWNDIWIPEFGRKLDQKCGKIKKNGWKIRKKCPKIIRNSIKRSNFIFLRTIFYFSLIPHLMCQKMRLFFLFILWNFLEHLNPDNLR